MDPSTFRERHPDVDDDEMVTKNQPNFGLVKVGQPPSASPPSLQPE